MSGVLKKDDNGYPVSGGVSTSDSSVVLNAKINPSTGRLLVDAGPTTATTWTSTGNTMVVTNANVTATSMVSFMWATPPAGFWAVVCGSGTFTITSSDSESAGLAFTYKVSV